MKNLILFLVLGFNISAFADKVDDLHTEVEAEQMDLYDQKALEDEARKESNLLEAQARTLESEMKKMRRESQQLSSKITFQRERFAKLQRIASQAEGQAKRTQNQRNRLKGQMESLQVRNSQLEKRAQSASEVLADLQSEIRSQSTEKRQLEQKIQQTNQRITRAQNDIRKLKTQQRRLSQNNRQLKQSLAKREAIARKLEEQALAREM